MIDPSQDHDFTGLATSLERNTRTLNDLACIISGFRLNRKGIPIAVVSIPDQARTSWSYVCETGSIFLKVMLEVEPFIK